MHLGWHLNMIDPGWKDWGDEMIACPDSVAKAGVSSACLPVHPSGSKAMSKFYTW